MGYSDTQLITIIAKKEQSKKLTNYVTNVLNKIQPISSYLGYRTELVGDYTLATYDNGYPYGQSELEEYAIMQALPDCHVVSMSYCDCDVDDITLKLDNEVVVEIKCFCNMFEDELEFSIDWNSKWPDLQDYYNKNLVDKEPFQICRALKQYIMDKLTSYI